MKLEPKYITPYLNYKLEVTYIDCITSRKRKAYLSGVNIIDGIETTYKRKIKGVSGDLISWEGNNNISKLSLKLILTPLSSLPKEVLSEFNFTSAPDYLDDISLFSYDFVEYCFENHYDIFGLINKNIAEIKKP